MLLSVVLPILFLIAIGICLSLYIKNKKNKMKLEGMKFKAE